MQASLSPVPSGQRECPLRYLHDLSGQKQGGVLTKFADLRKGAADVTMSEKSLTRYLKGQTPSDPRVSALLVRVYIQEIERKLLDLLANIQTPVHRGRLPDLLSSADLARELNSVLQRAMNSVRELEGVRGLKTPDIKEILDSLLPPSNPPMSLPAAETPDQGSPQLTAQPAERETWVTLLQRKKAAAILAALAASGFIMGLAGGYLALNHTASTSAAMLVSPSLIKSHEASVWGQIPVGQSLEVVLYVKPEDGRSVYYRDLTSVEYHRDGSWIAPVARFGNRDNADMNKPPPLDFQLFAVIVAQGTTGLPGTISSPGTPYPTENAFRESVKRTGALHVVGPRVVHRIPSTCDGRPVISRIATGAEAVRIEWRPKMTAFVEIRRETAVLDSGFGYYSDGSWEGSLQPGRYDVTLRTRENSDCFSQEAFEVPQNRVGPPGKSDQKGASNPFSAAPPTLRDH